MMGSACLGNGWGGEFSVTEGFCSMVIGGRGLLHNKDEILGIGRVFE